MGFFDGAVAAANQRAAVRRAERDTEGPPPGWNDVPTSVGWERLIWRGEHAAAAIGDLKATMAGFGFTISLRWSSADLRQPPAPRARQEAEIRLILADGRQVSSDRFARDPHAPILHSLGGSTSSGGRYNQGEHQYWAAPLPPPGPLTLVFDWPPQGAASVQVGLDAEAIIAAAARSLRFWDDQP